jgi:hypothetical protein
LARACASIAEPFSTVASTSATADEDLHHAAVDGDRELIEISRVVVVDRGPRASYAGRARTRRKPRW